MKSKPATAAVLLAALLLPLSASAQDAETVTVHATGYGVDPDAAKKAAGRAAIEQVVGQLVDAETLVENDELVKDRILTHSAAFLEDVETVGEPAESDGLWTVKVRATVRKTQLSKKLAAENVSRAEVKKGKLFAQAASRQQEAGDAAAMVEALFENFPSGIVKAEVCRDAEGQPAVRVADANGTVEVDVEISVDATAWKDWANGARLKLDKMAASFEDAAWDLSRFRGGPGIDVRPVGNGKFRNIPATGVVRNRWGEQDNSAGFRLAFATSVREDSSRLSVREYRFDGNNAKRVGDALWAAVPQRIRLDVSLMAGGDCLDMRTVRIDGSVFKPKSKWGGSAITSGNANFLLAPAVLASRGLDETPFFRKARFTVQLGPLSSESLEEADDVAIKTTFLVPDPKDAGRFDWGWVEKPAVTR